jgi:thioredoxin 1
MITVMIKNKIGSVMMVFALLAIFTSCNAQPQVNTTQFEQAMKASNTVLVDVRTPQEFASGHIDKAVNIDIYDRSFQTKALALDKSKTVLVYCRSGSRSAQAATFFRKQGYQVVDLAGGIGSWTSAGKKIVN